MSKRVVILGAGESGTGAAILAKAKGFDVFVSDYGAIKEQYKAELQQHQIPFEENGHTYDAILNASLIIKSPGIAEKEKSLRKHVQQESKLLMNWNLLTNTFKEGLLPLLERTARQRLHF